MMAPAELESVYRGRRVLLTGHTGFKGGWLSIWLSELGASVTGVSLAPPTTPNLFEAGRVRERLAHVEADIRDLERMRAVWRQCRPEIVFHLAGQSLVRESYADPIRTVQTNVLGTTHLLELARTEARPVAMVLVTSDKCYENREWVYPYREEDRLGGSDLYSMSKAGAELAASAYRRAFFPPERLAEHGMAMATARAGNVFGGGDWAADRLVPDCFRALLEGRPILVRSPGAVRPWQHVLEPLSGYLLLGARLFDGDTAARARVCEAWNFGPAGANARPVRELVEAIVVAWGEGGWRAESSPDAPHEHTLLRLAIDKARAELGWRPRWDLETAVAHTVQWYKAFRAGDDMAEWCRLQIVEYGGLGR